jgi:hypothetical protein
VAEATAANTRYDAILDTAWAVGDGHAAAFFTDRLASDDPAVRFWGVAGTGWAALQAGADPSAALKPLLADADPSVRVGAATWLLRCGPTVADDEARATLSAAREEDGDDVGERRAGERMRRRKRSGSAP